MSEHEEVLLPTKNTKRKRVSKRSKRSWRKHTDINDVEEHIEGIRQEERTGGIIAEKKSENLFFLEKTVVESGPPTQKSKKKLPDDELEDEEVYVPRKIRVAAKQIAEQEKEKIERENEKIKPDTSLWGPKIKKTSPVDEDPFLEDTLPKKPKKPTTVGERISRLPAVAVGEGGQSYNPEYEDHQALLSKAVSVEVEKMTRREKLDRKIKYLTPEEMANKPTWIEEMSEGLGDNKKTKEDDTQEVDKEETVSLIPVGTERKTKRKKRKEKEEKEKQLKLLKVKEDKKRLNDVYRLKAIQKEIKETEEKHMKKELKRVEKKEREADNPKKLGKYKYQEPNIPLKLTEELVGTLRELKPEGNLLEDRFRSYQKRNIIETRKPVVRHRRYKIKEYEKRSYKKPTIKELGET